MSVVKTKTLIVDILSNNNKNELGGIDLEKNIIECKKLTKIIKLKYKDIDKKKKNNEDVTILQQEISRLDLDLSNLYTERLINLFNIKDFTSNIINSHFTSYSKKIDEYKQKLLTFGDTDYNTYYKQEQGKVDKSGGKQRNIMTKSVYDDKFIGNHEKANIEKKLTYDLFKLYEKFKKDIKSASIKREIIEKETSLKNYHIKQKIKQINTRQLSVFISHIKSITQLYINDIKTLISSLSDSPDSNKLQSFTSFIKSKDLRSSKSNLFKNMIRFSHYYKLIIDKSKDEKNIEIDILDLPDGKDVKNFVETNKTLKFILEKNSINTYLNKEFKDISIDNKTKNFLTYLIIVHFYNDIIPLLNLSKPFMVPYKKKETTKDEKGNIISTQYIDSEKNVSLVLNRLHANVIDNMWNPSFV